jgi:FemAB-related protein (PEP-CTERM system-associated)
VIEVRPCGDRPVEWDAVVGADPEGSHEQLAGWQRVMTDALGHECLYLGAVDGSEALVGVLPLVRVRSRIFGHYLVSLPFLNAGGPLGNAEARAALVQRAVDEARKSGADLLEFRTRSAAPDGLVVSHRKITHELDLPADPDALWTKLPAKVRSQIRRPTKDGLVVQLGAEHLRAFYEVFARHMRVLGTPVLPWAWFTAIATHFPDQLIVAVVYDGNTPVAGGCGFHWRGRCEITWASARREWSRSAPNMLLYWAFLQEAIARGATRFDFGRCSPGSATHAFKRQWGGEDRPLGWGQWRRGAVAATPAPTSLPYRIASACWSRLPLAVTNALGPRLARCIP